MFAVNDVVNYSTTGVCRVEEISVCEIAGEKKEFYILKPLYDNNATVMVPTENQLLVSRMYNIMSKDEVDNLISNMPSIKPIWQDDDRLRYEEYKSILSSGKRSEVVGIIKALYSHRKYQVKKGRKLRTSDERVMRDAERLVYSEIAYVLGIDPKEVLQFIIKGLPQEADM